MASTVRVCTGWKEEYEATAAFDTDAMGKPAFYGPTSARRHLPIPFSLFFPLLSLVQSGRIVDPFVSYAGQWEDALSYRGQSSKSVLVEKA